MDTHPSTRKPYPTDGSDEAWQFVAPSLTLMVAEAPQRRHDLWEVFNALLDRGGVLRLPQQERLPSLGQVRNSRTCACECLLTICLRNRVFSPSTRARIR
jgi:hypothetical protein